MFLIFFKIKRTVNLWLWNWNNSYLDFYSELARATIEFLASLRT